jgi:curved DNA-binding protein CbpA
MSAWECLGIPEGSDRSTIRRAYHKRSLEWHPDKWSIARDVVSTALLRSKVETIYARINAAYQQLLHQEPTDTQT